MRKPAAHAARISGSSSARRREAGRTPAPRDPAMTPGSRIRFTGAGRRRRPVIWSRGTYSRAPVALGSPSAADAQTLDEGLIALFVLLLDVIEQRSPLRDNLEQAAAGMVGFDVGFEVSRQVGDPLGENRYLSFRRPGVASFQSVLVNERALAL